MFATALRAAGYGLSNDRVSALLKMTGPTTPWRNGAGEEADADGVGEPSGSTAAGQAAAPPIRSAAVAAPT
jgi:hypothetical protein